MSVQQIIGICMLVPLVAVIINDIGWKRFLAVIGFTAWIVTAIHLMTL